MPYYTGFKLNFGRIGQADPACAGLKLPPSSLGCDDGIDLTVLNNCVDLEIRTGASAHIQPVAGNLNLVVGLSTPATML